jgi:Mg2+ and Co2+ transporter CorA
MGKVEQINDIVDEEETIKEDIEEELEKLKSKWFKFHSTEKLIEFLEFYLKLKKEELKKIEEWRKKYLNT